jgi:hypothetical protein
LALGFLLRNLPDKIEAAQNPTPVHTILWDTANIPQTVKTRPIAAKITGIVAFLDTKLFTFYQGRQFQEVVVPYQSFP